LADKNQPAAELIYNALCMLQHRGQDAAGIVTSNNGFLNLKKSNGLVSEVFNQDVMTELTGNIGLGHVRYPTAGCSTTAEAQPFYTNTPCGVCLAHNGNLTNTEELRVAMKKYGRHINTTSDSEVLLNVFAAALPSSVAAADLTVDDIMTAGRLVHQNCVGGFACVLLINNVGIVALRDRFGIRPLCYGTRGGRGSKSSDSSTISTNSTNISSECKDSTPPSPSSSSGFTPFGKSGSGSGVDYIFASESVACDPLGFDLQDDVAPGETVFVDSRTGLLHKQQTATHAVLSPCIFELVYFARPDSFLDGISVYQARLNMGAKLAKKIKRVHPDYQDIDVVIPIPDTSRTSALQIAYDLAIPYREGFIKNRYIARTFIMPGQKMRKKNVRRKLNPIKKEFLGKNVLLVDDSIVRGTTATQIIQLAREAGAAKVFFCSAAPAVRHPNVYGIDMPVKTEFVAHERNESEIGRVLGVDWLLYQDLDDLEAACRELNPKLRAFDTSCFDGHYVTGDIDANYLKGLNDERNDKSKSDKNKKYLRSFSGGEGSNDIQSGGGF
jgi:amidophosphoribosyltransferase